MTGTHTKTRANPFEVFPDASGAWRWRLRGLNGEIMGTSEAFVGGESHARRGINDAVEAVGVSLNLSGMSGDVGASAKRVDA
jgi:uncharacterized protein YegP (UPF0339 family)